MTAFRTVPTMEPSMPPGREQRWGPRARAVDGRIEPTGHAGSELPMPERSLRLAVVTDTYAPETNGVAITAACFVEGLLQRGHSIELFRPRRDEQDSARHEPAFREHLFPSVPLPLYRQVRLARPSPGTLRRRWRERPPDLVHVVTEGPLGWSALRAARSLGLPVVTDFRTNFHLYSRHYGLRWLEQPILAWQRALHGRALATMVPTVAMRDQLAAEGFGHLSVVGRGVDTGRFDPARRSTDLRASWRVAADTPVVLTVGRLAEEKNLGLACAAFEAIRRRRPDARLVMVGDGPAREALRSRCPTALFVGERRGEDLATHYASADLFLFPSLTETFGNVTLEALASGLPVLAYDLAAAGSLITSGRDGVLVPAGDEAGFVAEACSLSVDPQRRRQMAVQARALATTCTWSRTVARQEAVMVAAIRAQPTRRPSLGVGLTPIPARRRTWPR